MLLSCQYRRPPHACLIAVAGVLAGLAGLPYPVLAQTTIITNAAAVRALTMSEAAEARPVRLRGVVIDRSDPWERAVVVADTTAGLYALADTNLFAPYQRGDWLDLTGTTDPGEFAPILKVRSVTKLGTALLPTPQPVTHHQLLTGMLDAQWVEIRGVIQYCSPPTPGTDDRRAVLSADGGLVHIILRGPQDSSLVVDAQVRVPAVCLYQFNQKRQFLSPVLVVPNGLRVLIERPAPAEPFATPMRLASSLLLYSPGTPPGHQVHVRGVVTHSQAGSTVWIRDASSGLRLQTRAPETATPGDLIEVLGFPKYGAATPRLEEAVFRKLGTTNPPAPLALVSPTNAFAHEDNLVSVEAKLTEVAPVLEGIALLLEAEGVVFKAALKQPAAAHQRLGWQPGSRVRVAGICSVTYDESRPVMGIWHPESFQLLLRSPADLTILRAPSWWTLQHIVYLLGLATSGMLLVTGVIMLLARRRLREQAARRAMAEAEFAAILAERNRMAREIHDTLAQGLVATSVQLRLARKHASAAPVTLTAHLETAQQLVSSSLEEARSSIWNMRSQVLETGDLASALKGILTQMADGTEVATGFEVTGKVRRLSPVLENNLLRIGQEAITNATKHAKAGRITVALDFGEKQFRLEVSDDGRGFDTARPGPPADGFGLVGMQERAAHIKGELQVHSQPGQGTGVRLTVPLSGM